MLFGVALVLSLHEIAGKIQAFFGIHAIENLKGRETSVSFRIVCSHLIRAYRVKCMRSLIFLSRVFTLNR
jgi:hypothetical protein